MRYWLLALLLAVAGCSTSKDAVETGGSFQFVAPGGQILWRHNGELNPAVLARKVQEALAKK